MKSYDEICDYLMNHSLMDDKVYKNIMGNFGNIVFIIKDIIYNPEKKFKNDDYEMVIETILLPRINVIKREIEKLIILLGYDASKITSLCDKVEYINVKNKNSSCDEINKLYQEFIVIRNGIWNYYLYFLNAILERCKYDKRYDDLYQEAGMALMKAIEKFGFNNYNFKGFAATYINYDIDYHYHDLDLYLKMPINKRHLYYKTYKAIIKYTEEYHKMPTRDDLMSMLRITGRTLSNFLSLSMTDFISLDNDTYCDDELVSSGEVYSNNLNIRHIEDEVINETLKSLLDEIFNELTDRERMVINDRYLRKDRLSMGQIKEKIGVSYRTALNIRDRAFIKIRRHKDELGKYLR